ncbi:unnamed protein product [Linum tenue]|uniref:Uncharacterized protein n=1 Tax=Linum tenue TaxID=586396 RepID=A0AAV0QW03_9ROSI|nr:unnamed protein product [Linum tenue]
MISEQDPSVCRIKGTSFEVITETEDQVEVSFTRTWDPSLQGKQVPLKQRYMPLPDDRIPPRGQPLAYPEAVQLVNPVEAELKGEVDDKYQYSCDNKDNKVHGWICTDPPVGFWQITPSDEFRSGGPVKQNLTSHFISAHYSGEDLVPKIGDGEEWEKVFGPVFMYFNTTPVDASEDPKASLWEDAKAQVQ